MKRAAMSPSKQAKAAGLKSLREVVRVAGVGESTLYQWGHTRPELLEVVILGVAAKLLQTPKKGS